MVEIFLGVGEGQKKPAACRVKHNIIFTKKS